MMSLYYLYQSHERLSRLPRPVTLKDPIPLHNEIENDLGLPPTAAANLCKVLQAEPSPVPGTPSYTDSLKFCVERCLSLTLSFFNGLPLPLSSEPEEAHGVIQSEMRDLIGMVMDGKVTDRTPRSV